MPDAAAAKVFLKSLAEALLTIKVGLTGAEQLLCLMERLVSGLGT